LLVVVQAHQAVVTVLLSRGVNANDHNLEESVLAIVAMQGQQD